MDFFETHQYNWKWFLGSVVAYVAVYDTWFYWTHRAIHEVSWFWFNVHYIHHEFKEPTPFAQFAVHPLEGFIHGPLAHQMVTFVFPVHPVALACFGLFGSVWALCAHDGRALDFNSHYYHHSKGRGRLCYFNLGYMTPFWDVVCGTRWHEDHPMWADWKSKRNNQIFDTRDGSRTGTVNDIYGAYDKKKEF